MAHSVSAHLQVKIADYDRFIRTVIPGYDTMRAVQLRLLERCLPADGKVLDLGGGTGALAAEIAAKFPGVHLEIWDTDPEMLAVAHERCRPFGERVRTVERSFAGPLPPCDAVVACIALHHVKNLAVKEKVYSHVRRALGPRGIFLNADCVMSTEPRLREQGFRSWSNFLAQNGIGEPQQQRYFAEWAKEDYYPPLSAELDLLKAAGFAEPDCFWCEAPFAVFGGVR